MNCEAELCPYWTGQGCACQVLDLKVFEYAEPDPEPLDDACGCCAYCDFCFCHWT